MKSIARKDGKTYTLLNPDGSLAPDYYKKSFLETIKKALGLTAEQIIEV